MILLKQIAATILLSILLFNWCGYRLMISLLEDQANKALEEQLDQSMYDDDQLLSVKVPVDYLPYYNNSKQFERVDGQIEIKGIQYKYVKRRIYHDSLEMLCIPNHSVMKLRKAENEFFKFVNDLQPEKKTGHHSGSSRNMATECYPSNDPFEVNSRSISLFKPVAFFRFELTPAHLFRLEHPPKIS